MKKSFLSIASTILSLAVLITSISCNKKNESGNSSESKSSNKTVYENAKEFSTITLSDDTIVLNAAAIVVKGKPSEERIEAKGTYKKENGKLKINWKDITCYDKNKKAVKDDMTLKTLKGLLEMLKQSSFEIDDNSITESMFGQKQIFTKK